MMDFRGASWVGDICQKFEAMYLEVEETICEDAVKFVGSQVQNVGSNMKKFYTDVMQDLAPPDSTDPDTKTDENNKSGNKEDTKQVGNQFTNDLKVIDQVDGDQVSSIDEDKTVSFKKVPKTNMKKLYTDVKQDLASPDSTAPDTKIDENNKSGDKEDAKQVGDQFTNDLKVIDEVDGDQVSSLDEDKTVTCKKVLKKDCCHKTTSMNQVSEYRVSDNQNGASLVPEIIHEYATPEHMASIETNFSVKSYALGDSKTCQSTGELVALSDTGKKVVSKTNYTMDLKGETANDDKIELEESCVFVNENSISFSSYKDGKPRSYKKKMGEVLSLKKKSSRRQEYKQLVTQYESANTSSSLPCVDAVPHTVSPESNMAELSDWELV